MPMELGFYIALQNYQRGHPTQGPPSANRYILDQEGGFILDENGFDELVDEKFAA